MKGFVLASDVFRVFTAHRGEMTTQEFERTFPSLEKRKYLLKNWVERTRQNTYRVPSSKMLALSKNAVYLEALTLGSPTVYEEVKKAGFRYGGSSATHAYDLEKGKFFSPARQLEIRSPFFAPDVVNYERGYIRFFNAENPLQLFKHHQKALFNFVTSVSTLENVTAFNFFEEAMLRWHPDSPLHSPPVSMEVVYDSALSARRELWKRPVEFIRQRPLLTPPISIGLESGGVVYSDYLPNTFSTLKAQQALLAGKTAHQTDPAIFFSSGRGFPLHETRLRRLKGSAQQVLLGDIRTFQHLKSVVGEAFIPALEKWAGVGLIKYLPVACLALAVGNVAQAAEPVKVLNEEAAGFAGFLGGAAAGTAFCYPIPIPSLRFACTAAYGFVGSQIGTYFADEWYDFSRSPMMAPIVEWTQPAVEWTRQAWETTCQTAKDLWDSVTLIPAAYGAEDDSLMRRREDFLENLRAGQKDIEDSRNSGTYSEAELLKKIDTFSDDLMTRSENEYSAVERVSICPRDPDAKVNDLFCRPMLERSTNTDPLVIKCEHRYVTPAQPPKAPVFSTADICPSGSKFSTAMLFDNRSRGPSTADLLRPSNPLPTIGRTSATTFSTTLQSLRQEPFLPSGMGSEFGKSVLARYGI
jgi:hypothetical protein